MVCVDEVVETGIWGGEYVVSYEVGRWEEYGFSLKKRWFQWFKNLAVEM